MRTPVQRLAAALLTLVALAAPAAASHHHHHHYPRAFGSVRLVDLPTGGTLIHFRAAGYVRAVVESSEAIAVAALRDIDADGDLDIIASSGHGLMVWRNLGAGRFVLAAPPKGKLHRRPGLGLGESQPPNQTSGIGEQQQQFAAARIQPTTRVAPAASPTPPPAPCPRATVSRAHAGRAPPTHA